MSLEDSNHEWDQNNSDAYTVCLFGRVAVGSKPELNSVVWGKDAYECYQGYSYLKEHIRVLKEKDNSTISPINFFAYVYIALSVLQQKRFVEFQELVTG